MSRVRTPSALRRKLRPAFQTDPVTAHTVAVQVTSSEATFCDHCGATINQSVDKSSVDEQQASTIQEMSNSLDRVRAEIASMRTADVFASVVDE